MSKDRKKRKEGRRGSLPNSSNNSPSSDPDISNIRSNPVENTPIDTSGTAIDQPTNVDSLLSSLREEALGPLPPPPSAPCTASQEDDWESLASHQLPARQQIL